MGNKQASAPPKILAPSSVRLSAQQSAGVVSTRGADRPAALDLLSTLPVYPCFVGHVHAVYTVRSSLNEGETRPETMDGTNLSTNLMPRRKGRLSGGT